jgi:Tfp pilus assembly protein PilX
MIETTKRILGNENGFVLGASMLISAILLLAGVLALWTSTTEMHVVRNENDLSREFYAAEGGVIDALENYDTGSTQWLTDAFLLADPEAASASVTSINEDGQAAATVAVRCIQNANSTVAAANNLPVQAHQAPPPEGSGFSLKYFEVRRYGITATSATGNTRIQMGAYKVFNKY